MNAAIFLLVPIVVVFALVVYYLFARQRQTKNELTGVEAERQTLKGEKESLEQALEKYRGIIDLEAKQRLIKDENEEITALNLQLRNKGIEIRNAVADLKSQVVDLEDERNLQEYGLYKPKYDFGTSIQYKAEIADVRKKQKEMIRNKTAILWGQDWVVGGSAAKGRTVMNQRTKLTLRAFNGECDSLILKVKYNNVKQIDKRMAKLYVAINKIGESMKCSIAPAYLKLKAQELYLVHEYQEKLQAEREEQRQIRAQMREEQRALKEIEKAQRDAEKEEKRYMAALEKARLEMEQATGEKQDRLEGEIERLNQALMEAQKEKERALSRAQMTKSGHVYIVSNIGSFGQNIYKIGMTRRLEPLDRVKELSDASVPFVFDVHAMIYAEDAPDLENFLHKKFDARRLNMVNFRKEFFRVSLDEVVQAVSEKRLDVEFTLKADAVDYYKTKEIMAEEDEAKTSQPKSDEDIYDELFGM